MKTLGGSHGGRVVALLAAAAIAALMVLVPATAAQAEPKFSLYPTSAKTQSVEYGSEWSVTYHLSRKYNPCPSCKASFDVKVAGKSTEFVHRYADYAGDYAVSFGNYTSSGAPLAVGSYVFSLVYHVEGGRYGYSSSSVTLNVVPASLTTSVDIQSDPNHKSHAILSASMTGKFVDVANQFEDAPDTSRFSRIPAGTWNFSVKNPAGRVVHTAAVTSDTGAPAFASTYWTDLPPATVFTASAMFTPDSSVASNFAPTAADPVSYTSAAAPPGQAVPSAPPTSNPTSTKIQGVAVPIWSAGAWGIVVLILLIALLLLIFRRTERSQKKVADASVGLEQAGPDNED